MRDLYIIGAGGFGREVADTVHAINARGQQYRLAGFIDDNEGIWGKDINDITVLGGRARLKELCQEAGGPGAVSAVMALASAKAKRAIARDLDGHVRWENIIHPTAVVSRYAEIGQGAVIQPHVFVSANTKIGDHCMMNNCSVLGHDAVLGDFASVMDFCDITGGVRIGEGAFVASSVAIIPDIVVNENAYICAGSVVFRDVPPGAMVIGNPAAPKQTSPRRG
ncbi:MAG: NeuD/PglB/VioB family sugar acetyltransferase [Clostridiales Family XIII bacterium]|jgi:sugar O-acyltransferase (sialic acid O-acetyltransferase NeuD family)|nr:NeuD/PglB/VioB family sugar acetyltransferase [Clostridiales Family XIII bacterium]